MCEVCAQFGNNPHALLYALRKAAGTRAISEDVLEAEWIEVTRIKVVGERSLARTVSSVFASQEEETLARLASVSNSLFFDIHAWAEDMARRMGPQVLEIILNGWTALLARIGGSLETQPFNPGNPYVRTALKELLGKTRGITETTVDALTRSITEGVVGGEDLDALAKRVTKVFSQAKGYRARMIAHTAATPAFETGQLTSMRQAGIGSRAWLSARLKTSREAHVAADGQERKLDEPFDIGGEALLYPGDPNGSAKNVIWCYCSQLPMP